MVGVAVTSVTAVTSLTSVPFSLLAVVLTTAGARVVWDTTMPKRKTECVSNLVLLLTKPSQMLKQQTTHQHWYNTNTASYLTCSWRLHMWPIDLKQKMSKVICIYSFVELWPPWYREGFGTGCLQVGRYLNVLNNFSTTSELEKRLNVSTWAEQLPHCGNNHYNHISQTLNRPHPLQEMQLFRKRVIGFTNSALATCLPQFAQRNPLCLASTLFHLIRKSPWRHHGLREQKSKSMD